MAILNEEKLQAIRALRKTLTERQWPESKLKRQGRMTRETLATLEAHRHVPEVQELLRDLQNNLWRVVADGGITSSTNISTMIFCNRRRNWTHGLRPCWLTPTRRFTSWAIGISFTRNVPAAWQW